MSISNSRLLELVGKRLKDALYKAPNGGFLDVSGDIQATFKYKDVRGWTSSYILLALSGNGSLATYKAKCFLSGLEDAQDIDGFKSVDLDTVVINTAYSQSFAFMERHEGKDLERTIEMGLKTVAELMQDLREEAEMES